MMMMMTDDFAELNLVVGTHAISIYRIFVLTYVYLFVEQLLC